MPQTRQLPEGAVLISAPVRGASSVAAFCAKQPLKAAGSFIRALRALPSLRHVIADLRFDLYSISLVEMLKDEIASAVRDIEEILFYAFWLHVPARAAVETRSALGQTSATAVSRANGFDLYVERRADGYLPQRRLLLSQLDVVFAASSSAEDYLRKHYPAYASKFTTDRIGTSPAVNAGNADRDAMHLVSCSYIAPVKRLKMLIDDVAEAQTSVADSITWTHIGSGDPAYEVEIMSYAAQRLSPGSFRFLGHMESRELREWYARNPSSAFVQVSESEGGLAASIQEGLAQGLPVIATSVGGVSALSHDPDVFAGLLDAQHTPRQFADRLSLLLHTNDEEYQRYVAASMSYWTAHCSADTLASAFARRLRALPKDIGERRAHWGD
ncbi:glycosyltransferase [Microbacterium sp. NPDC058345]|uniref:glycosyltransferase n=1 Tax=Microbacterium sp. NPDC058345 TaxID=3346455 RepID=UPI003650B4FC